MIKKRPSISDSIWDQTPPVKGLTVQRPQYIPEADESIEFHAARVLLLIYYVGETSTKKISGRTKLAKLDFFVRYPTYLVEAARIKHVKTSIAPVARPESLMIRYKYGP